MDEENLILEKGKSFLDYWKVIRSRLKTVVIPFVAVPLAVLVVNLLQAPEYTADSYLRVRERQGGTFPDMVGVDIPTEIDLIKSRSVMDDAIRKFRIDERYDQYRSNGYFEEDVANLKKNVDVARAGRVENIVKITARSHIPELARDFADVVAQTAIEHNLSFRKLEAQKTREYIEGQQLLVAAKLGEAEEKLREFMVKNKMVKLEGQVAGQGGGSSVLEEINPLLTIENNAMPLRQKVASLSQIYSDDYPELKQARGELAAMEAYRRKLESGIEAYPDKKFEFAKYVREAAVYERDYENLGTAAREARLKEVATVSDYFVVDPAIVPVMPSYPRTLRNTGLGALVGLILGLSLAIFFDHLDTTVKEASEIESDFGLTLLGRIPFVDIETREAIKGRKRRKRALPGYETTAAEVLANLSDRLVTHYDPKHYVTEAFRQLYTNFVYSLQDNGVKTFAVSSPGPSEGKTSISVNMAVIAASLGKKVLVVDVDLRKPMIHNLFSLGQEPGISNVLMDGVPLEDAIRPSGVENVEILTSGHLPPAPMLLLNSPRFVPLVEDMSGRYDLVIFDTPPIDVAADTSILASKIEGLLLVVCRNRTDRGALADALQIMSNARAKVLGAVFNSVMAEHHYGYSRYGYRSYSRYRYGYGRGYGYGYGYGYGHGYGQKAPRNGFQRLITDRLVFIQDFTKRKMSGLLKKNKCA